MVGWELPAERIAPRVLEPEEVTARPLEELARLLARGSSLVEDLRRRDNESPRGPRDEQERLRRELAESRSEIAALGEMLARLEHRSTQLTNLYVATFQLYAGRDPDQVYETIAEISSDILGAKRFALLMRDGDAPHCRIVLRHGFDARPGELFGKDTYTGGHPAVDGALTRGTRWVQSGAGNGMVAIVPLQVDQTILGALAILELLDHKPRLDDADTEILDLLGAHAASALLSSMNLSSTLRKLQTMTSLFRLVIGDTGDP